MPDNSPSISDYDLKSRLVRLRVVNFSGRLGKISLFFGNKSWKSEKFEKLDTAK